MVDARLLQRGRKILKTNGLIAEKYDLVRCQLNFRMLHIDKNPLMGAPGEDERAENGQYSKNLFHGAHIISNYPAVG